jgi:hypothetical protein
MWDDLNQLLSEPNTPKHGSNAFQRTSTLEQKTIALITP